MSLFLPPGQCCAHGYFQTGQPLGQYQEIGELDTYVVGDSDNVIVILTDVHGHKFNNTLLVADELASHGYKVLVPDILNGDPIEWGGDLSKWLINHTPEITSPIISNFLQKIQLELKPSNVFGIGYCFGARFILENLMNETANGKKLLSAGAIAHPAFIDKEQISKLQNTWLLLSLAETDPYHPPHLRVETEEELKKLAQEQNVVYEVTIFSQCEHGYALRGDIRKPAVRYAKNKTILDQVHFFKSFEEEMNYNSQI
ncbi:hypothetical protein KGF54_001670 [Candida jiufengensis]|uniref:uncharacterized protein n=1 Tax=Candida jiufengensis TaxID=497108 RepID=UPI00222579F7|nr:uncharacterized protein KGF54_001670 [Candida jiufengensis]KAI5955109.1 hypothetical protein KGF54_001670 [Candida jiufengensis]